MLYTLFILFSGIYLGQEYAVIPSIRILLANLLVYLRTLQDPGVAGVEENIPTYFDRLKNLFFW